MTGGDTEATRAAKRLGEERGLDVVLFGGGNLSIQQNGRTVSAQAFISGNRVYVRADHPDYTADQLMRHEAGHDMIAKGELDPATVRQRIAESFGEAKLDQLAELYSAAYRSSDLTPSEVWEEVVCDSLGDMNIFHDIPVMEEHAQELLDETKKAAGADIETMRVRGPPTAAAEDKASRQYWRPNLKQGEWLLLNRRMEQEISGDQHKLDDDTKWVYANEKGVQVFAIYGIGDGTDATPLYAVGGKKSQAAYELLMSKMEGAKNGIDTNREDVGSWINSVRGDREYGRRNFDAAGRAGESAKETNQLYGGAPESNTEGTAGAVNRNDKVNTRDSGQIKNVTNENRAGDPDIRFSQDLAELDALRKENERLKSRVEHWKGQLRQTTPEIRSVRQGDIDRLARQLVRNYGGTLKASDISGRLKALGDLIVRGGDDFTWASAHEKAPSALHGRSPFAFFTPARRPAPS